MSAAETAEAPDRSAFASLQEAMEQAVDYLGGAGASAGASVKSAAGRTGEIAGAGVYRSAYGLSYGLVFSAVFLKELLPTGNAVRRGFEDGAEAAFDAIEARKAPAEPVEDEAPEAAPKPRTRKAAKPAE